jgi:hypothetical protein
MVLSALAIRRNPTVIIGAQWPKDWPTRRVGAGGLSADTVNRGRMGEFVALPRGFAFAILGPILVQV